MIFSFAKKHFCRFSLPFCLGSSVFFSHVVTAQTNTIFGEGAGVSAQSGSLSLFGYYAGHGMTDREETVVIGAEAGVGILDTTNGEQLDAGAVLLEPFNHTGNVLIGYRAGWQTGSGGFENIGSRAFDFTAVGWQAGQYNIGRDNTFIGSNAGVSNTTGYENTFIGEEAGNSNTSGRENTFVGEDAGFEVTTGNLNTFVGSLAGSEAVESSANTGIGYQALSDVSEGWNNTGIGSFAGADIGEGMANVFFGAQAGANTENASFNISVGAFAGWDNNRTNFTTEGNRNINIGTAAGFSNRQGGDNVVLGNFAGSGEWGATSLAIDNFAVDSRTEPDNLPTDINRNVSRRILVGGFARGDVNDTIALGYASEAIATRATAIGNAASAAHVDSIVIGYQGQSHGNDVMVLGNDGMLSVDPGADGVTPLGSATYRFSSTTAEAFSVVADEDGAASVLFQADNATDNDDLWRVEASDGGEWSISSNATGAYVPVVSASNDGNLTVVGDVNVTSDKRLKKEITAIHRASDLLSKIHGRTYEWKAGQDERRQFGLIAQEVEAVIPDLVKSQNGIKAVNYQGLIPLLIDSENEIEQHCDMIAETFAAQAILQNNRISQLEQELAQQEELLKRLVQEMNVPLSNEQFVE